MLRLLIDVFRDPFLSQASLKAEIVVLCHQVAVRRRRLGRNQLQLTWADRGLLIVISCFCSGWRDAVFIIQPNTVLRWTPPAPRSAELGMANLFLRSRTRLSPKNNTPGVRATAPTACGSVISLPEVGRLHHRYERLAA